MEKIIRHAHNELSVIRVKSHGKLYYESDSIDLRRSLELILAHSVSYGVPNYSGKFQTEVTFDGKFDVVRGAQFGIYMTLFVLILLVVSMIV